MPANFADHKPASSWFTVAGPGLLLLAATLATYFPVLSAGFVWNDSDYVTSPELRSLRGLQRIWTDIGATEQYYPLLHSAFWLQHRLWGDHAALYHVVNVCLHVGNACLFALILRGLAVPGAWLAAALFAVHPVCVESVAWISEQKNTLSLLFYLAAAWCYLPRDSSGRLPRYRWATVFFLLALLTKSLTATLPAALLVVAWWRHGSLEWRRDVRPLVPWFVLGAAVSLFTAWVEQSVVGAGEMEIALTPLQRGLLAGRVAWFYLGKLVWPANLSFIYPRWAVDVADWRWYAIAAAALALPAGLWLARGRSRGPLAAALLFGGSLIPVAGFFDLFGFVYSFVADHWQYLPSLPIFALAAAALAQLRPFATRLGGWAAPTLAAALLSGLAAVSWQHTHMYHDMVTFYLTIQRTNPDCWLPYNNLGQLWLDAGHRREAIPQFEAAIRLAPDAVQPHSNLAMALEQENRPTEALREYREALRLKPGAWEVLYNLGGLQRKLGRLDDAIASYQLALRYKPDFAFALYNLAISLRETGRPAKARIHYQQARQLDPSLPEVRF